MGISFLVLSVYDPKRIYKAMDEFQIVALATVASALLFAGLLFLTNRDFSRWVLSCCHVRRGDLAVGLAHPGADYFSHRPDARRRTSRAHRWRQRSGPARQPDDPDYRSMGLNLTGFLDEIVDNQSESDEYVVHSRPGGDVREVVQASHINDVVIASPQRDYAQINELSLAP